MFTVGQEVMRAKGTDARKGIVVEIRKAGEYAKYNGLFVKVAWHNSTNRINGNKTTHTKLQDNQLIPYSENVAKFRRSANALKHAEDSMKFNYSLFVSATIVEYQLIHAIELAKAEMRYNKLVGGHHTYDKCSCCGRSRVLEGGICGTCSHRKARRTNTKEMYGHGRRGY